MFTIRKFSAAALSIGLVLSGINAAHAGNNAATAPNTTMLNPNGSNYDDFGAAVALSHDGRIMLVGAPETITKTVSGTPAQVGRAYLFTGTKGGFPQQPNLTFNDPQPLQLDEFGSNLALSGDGSTILIAASGGDSGIPRVYVFSNAGSASTATLEDPDGGGDCFGQSLALSGDGNVALVGADCATTNGVGWAGKAYVYVRSAGVWSVTPVAVLTEPVPTENDFFATSVALSTDGHTALIGSDDYSSADPIGRAYVFSASGSTWNLNPIAVLQDPDAAAGSMFGSTVSLSGDGKTALVGAGNGASGKEAYLFHATGNIWSQSGAFNAPTAQTGSGFVNAVKLSANGNTALVGLLTGTGTGQLFVRKADGSWPSQATQMLADPAASNGDDFGWSAALSADGTTWSMGSPYAVSSASPAGSLFSSMPGPGRTYVYTAPGQQTQDVTHSQSQATADNVSSMDATQSATTAGSSGGGAFSLFGLLCLSIMAGLKTAIRRK